MKGIQRDNRWDQAFVAEKERLPGKILQVLIAWNLHRRERLPIELAILVLICVTLFVVIGTWGIVVALVLFVSRELILGLMIELLVVLILRRMKIEK